MSRALDSLVSVVVNRCKGTARGARPCKNIARIGFVTCGKHAAQESTIERREELWAAWMATQADGTGGAS